VKEVLSRPVGATDAVEESLSLLGLDAKADEMPADLTQGQRKLVGGFALIITLIVNPEGIAGTGWKKKQQKKKRLASGPAQPRRFTPRLSRAAGKETP